MLFLMINFVMNNFAPNWMFKPMNENQHLTNKTPLVANCRIVEDSETRWYMPSNNKMSCK